MMHPTGTRLVVLVVEDEFLLRMDAVDRISEAGYEVLDAKSADEAIQILEERSDVSILFTDIEMPGSMDGLKLARAVRNRWPPVKIIAASGYHKFQEDDLPDGSRHFSKPYSFSDIIPAIREMAC